jgi:ATP-dependent exoDNAse (exonuclease V) alpha subunit
MLPLVVGMKVMITENIAISQKIVNGAIGVVEKIIYDTNNDGCRFEICCYLHINGCGLQAPGLDKDVVPIIQVTNHFIYCSSNGAEYNISRTQLPLIPAFAYTDYKSQGRGLTHAIADLSSCGSIQSIYVMLSRVKSLEGLGVLKWFPSNILE